MRRSPFLVGIALVFVGFAGFGGTASANIAAVQERPGVLVAPRYATKTTLQVDGEELKFDCRGEGDDLVCSFTAHYRLSNPAAEPASALAAFYGIDATDVVVTVDGVVATKTLSPEEIATLDAAVFGEIEPPLATGGAIAETEETAANEEKAKAAKEAELHAGAPYLDRDARTEGDSGDASFGRFGFSITAAATGKHDVVVTGKVKPGRRWFPHGYTSSALLSRHSTFASDEKSEFLDLRYLVSPIRTWAGKPTSLSVEVRYPDEFELGGGDLWTTSHEGSTVVARRQVDSNEYILPFAFERKHRALVNGGLLLGMGGATGDFHGFRVRLAPELALSDWLFAHVAWDTDFKGRHCVAPVVMMAAPGFFFIPSFGVGLGLPVQVAPDKRAGARIHLDAFFGPVGFVTNIDVFPATKAQSDDVVQVTLLGVVGL